MVVGRAKHAGAMLESASELRMADIGGCLVELRHGGAAGHGARLESNDAGDLNQIEGVAFWPASASTQAQ